ncbi:hypothetical protein [Psychrobacter sp. CAL346-MNA-CIBAN-0220]|uniref:hypothetical protein n=1 Tax=Psychrobacter sp. CAL346-MNA-CIBAN-0220 TaxID=3140457 RepID=UPI003319AE85
MSGSVRMFNYRFIDRKLSDWELQALCWAIVHNTLFDPLPKTRQLIKPIPEKRFKLGTVPQESIIKLGKKEYIDSFFESGMLQLGSYSYYNKFNHSEIGDSKEGIVTLLAKTPSGVIGGTYGSGYNQHIFCASLGNPDRKTMERFGYDSGFVVNDPIGFSNAIAESIGAVSHTFSRCLYRPHKAVLGFPRKTINPHIISHQSAEIVNAAKHFIKPERYSHQKEFRFLWEMPSDLSGSEVIDCSSAIQYCSPLSLNDLS